MDEMTLIHGDCLEKMKKMTDKVDLVVTSPPYDNLRTYDGNMEFDFKGIAQQLYRILKDGGVIVWVVGDAVIDGSETGTSFKQALYFKKIGFNLHDTMIYEKDSNANPDSSRYHQVFEYMFVFSKNKPNIINLIKDRKNIYRTSQSSTSRQKDGSLIPKKDTFFSEYGIRRNIWKYGCGYMKSTKSEIAYQHPAIFPEKLAKDHILSWSNKDDIVLDPFMGSGTTGVACKELNRKFIGIEINKDYYEIAKKRIFNTQKSMF